MRGAPVPRRAGLRTSPAERTSEVRVERRAWTPTIAAEASMPSSPRTHALTPRELHEFERQLLELRAKLAREVGKIERDSLEPSGGERSQPIDESVEETSLEVELEALATEDELGYAVNEALERLATGRFGTCADCGVPIARERLALLPYARECRDCRAASESAR